MREERPLYVVQIDEQAKDAALKVESAVSRHIWHSRLAV